MVHHTGHAPLTGPPGNAAAEGSFGGERGNCPPAPIADGVHEARGLKVTGCRPRSLRGYEARTDGAGVSPQWRGQSRSTHPSGRATFSRHRGDVDRDGVSAAATVAVLASATEVKHGNAPPWRPDDE